MELMQFIIVIFALFALSRAILRFRDEKITVKELLFWTIIWIGGIVLVTLPATSIYFANLIGISRGVDVIIYPAIALLFYLIFRIYVKIESIEQDMTKIIREISLDKKRKK